MHRKFGGQKGEEEAVRGGVYTFAAIVRPFPVAVTAVLMALPVALAAVLNPLAVAFAAVLRPLPTYSIHRPRTSSDIGIAAKAFLPANSASREREILKGNFG